MPLIGRRRKKNSKTASTYLHDFMAIFLYMVVVAVFLLHIQTVAFVQGVRNMLCMAQESKKQSGRLLLS